MCIRDSNDIEQLRLSFIETLKGRFHVRVQYPGNELLLIENLPELALPTPPAALPESTLSEPALPRATQTANT